MTLFYYPASIEVALALAGRGEILCPWEYEVNRLADMLKEEERGKKMLESEGKGDAFLSTYHRLFDFYKANSHDDLALKLAGMRHPKDIRVKEGEQISEEEWLKSVTLYGDSKPALQHVSTPPSGVILVLRLSREPQPLLMIPESVSLKGRLKAVYVRTDPDKEVFVADSFRKYNPKFYRIKKS